MSDRKASCGETKCLGLIGHLNDSLLGQYGQTINGETRKSRGGRHSAELRAACLDAAELDRLLEEGNWDGLTECLVEHGRELHLAGADALVLCGSALQPVATEVRRALAMPLIDMGHAVGAKLREHEHARVGILGTRTPREQKWWRENLPGVTVLWPSVAEIQWLNDRMASVHAGHQIDIELKIETRRIIAGLRQREATAVLLAAPVLGRWVFANEVLIDHYDAAVIHAWTAARWAQEPGK